MSFANVDLVADIVSVSSASVVSCCCYRHTIDPWKRVQMFWIIALNYLHWVNVHSIDVLAQKPNHRKRDKQKSKKEKQKRDENVSIINGRIFCANRFIHAKEKDIVYQCRWFNGIFLNFFYIFIHLCVYSSISHAIK